MLRWQDEFGEAVRIVQFITEELIFVINIPLV